MFLSCSSHPLFPSLSPSLSLPLSPSLSCFSHVSLTFLLPSLPLSLPHTHTHISLLYSCCIDVVVTQVSFLHTHTLPLSLSLSCFSHVLLTLSIPNTLLYTLGETATCDESMVLLRRRLNND
jgi:hypothetical protein